MADTSAVAPRADEATMASASSSVVVLAWRARVASPSCGRSPSDVPLAIIELLPRIRTAAMAQDRHGERGGGLVAHRVALSTGAVDAA